jgi:hypothetical protein
MKKMILLIAVGVALTTQTLFAQVPSYVPTNGLVGYWPFNGNANDESGNGNNGVVDGAILTSDRNGLSDNAYQFNGNNKISVQNSISLSFSSGPMFSVSYWFKEDNASGLFGHIAKSDPFGPIEHGWNILSIDGASIDFQTNYPSSLLSTSNHGRPSNSWHHMVFTLSNGTQNVYKDGILLNSYYYSSMLTASISNTYPLLFGVERDGTEFLKGKIDDIGIWNRALTDQEITNLYNSVSSNECLTMVINTGVLSTNPVTYTSTVSIYPNPANDQITIDCGNLASVVGWNIKITNMLGQEVFNQPMNTQQYVVPLNTWTGQGMYFVKIINAQNEVVNIKKIILQ